jgi:hypothetical protein
MRRILTVVAVSFVSVIAGSAGCSNSSKDSQASSVSSSTIGSSGGLVKGDGVELDIPAGALSNDQTITVAATSDSAPDGVSALSPIYRFSPDGLVFAKPVVIKIAFSGDATGARVFWTKASSASFEDVGGSVSGSEVSAQIMHFSSGFVGTPTAGTGLQDSDSDASSNGTDAGASDAASDAAKGNCLNGQAYCNGACIDVAANPQHCGGCGNVCSSGICSQSRCVCKPGATACSSGAECCSGTCSGSCTTVQGCAANGIACTGPADCCSGVCDTTNHCKAPATS